MNFCFSILIGAPKDNSMYSKTNVTEPGAVYKCILDSRDCKIYELDKNGKNEVKGVKSSFGTTMNFTEWKDNQMFGMSIDGGEDEENDPFIACAPRFKYILPLSKNPVLYGMCIFVNETNSQKPQNPQKFVPFEIEPTSSFMGTGFGQAGFSVHIANDKSVILGAPTTSSYRGTVFTLNKNKRGVPKAKFPENSHVGFKVSSKKNKNLVASATKSGINGEVAVFEENSDSFRVLKHFGAKRNQEGEFFGYTFLIEDFNNDKKEDIVVSAPFYSKDGVYEHGCVYVYLGINHKNVKLNDIFRSTN